MSEALFRTAGDAAQMIRRKEISSRELTELLFARIAAVNLSLNAIVELRRDAAMQEAAAADEATAHGGELGPLHGVPMKAAGWVVCFWACSALADEAPKNATSGLAVAAGFGNDVVGLGGELLYYAEVGAQWRIVTRAGGGAFPSDGGTLGGIDIGLGAE